jgi:hypothetical protein
VTGLHGLAALAALANGLVLWGKIAALAVVGVSARHQLRKARQPPVSRVAVDAEQQWQVTLVSGQEVEARLLPGTVVTRWLTVLHLRDTAGRFHALTVGRDGVDREIYRRLCVRLHGANLSD